MVLDITKWTDEELERYAATLAELMPRRASDGEVRERYQIELTKVTDELSRRGVHTPKH